MPKSQVTLSGPFFERDPRKTFRQNIRVMMKAVGDEAAADMARQMAATESTRRPLSTGGRASALVTGRIVSLRGKRWAVTAAASINTAGKPRRVAIALNAAGAQIERQIHAARKTTSAMRRARAVLSANLLKGLQ